MAKRALILVEGHKGIGLLFVEAAERLGLHPVILSREPAQYDYLASGKIESIQVDTDNLDALIRECSRLRARYDIAGITGFVGDDESIYVTVGKLCRHFHLPGPDPASVERCCDKFVQRQLLAKANVPVPAYRLAVNAADIESSAAEMGLPVIVKPAASNGSIGVRLCRNVDELAEHTNCLLEGKHMWRSSPRIIVEEFVEGPQYTVELMGNEVIGIVAADYGPLPEFVYRQFTVPALLANDKQVCIADISLSCLRALDLGWGPTNIELRWTKAGPVVIEVNPRLAGAPDPQLIQASYGIDLIMEHIKLVIGAPWDLRPKHSHIASARILVPERDGILDWDDGPSRAAAVPGVVEVRLYVKPKTLIVRRGDSRDCVGYVVAVSPSLAETEAILQRAVDLIDWSIAAFQTTAEQHSAAQPKSGPS
ncbi:acetyl-CoA carboxylase biotin carboxylase subunit family protein [Mesorhizobium sp.]|uniref:ATP-grasp domain-containing protein n=1 Tax=Mesorhizobium sp. TaxID=1871066 RepID=UPI000FE5F9DC|nr:acetyl-CoA carboxylase biotin carboxylase subunit family protein [Mesorhizobium sp.]RWK33365.1 MAG: ATP-grasp domain-containing protein [Mesorhizobium sp.]